MKKLFLFVCVALLSVGTYAQIQTPAPSPFQKIEQKIGLTDVTLEYSRPSMKGRTIFGDLVPYGKMWRTGANANTKITFSNDVTIGGKKLKAGSYAIYTKPNPSNWEVYFYSDSNNWGTPQEWDDAKVVSVAKAEVFPMEMTVQTFTMSLDNVTNNSAQLGMIWEKTYVGVPIEFDTNTMVSASIDRVMAGPGAADYYSAAVYYLESGNDIQKAKTWIDKAIEMKSDAFWYFRQQSLIYAKAGDKEGAIKAAKRSLSMAKEAGNADYIALNEKSLKEWGAN